MNSFSYCVASSYRDHDCDSTLKCDQVQRVVRSHPIFCLRAASAPSGLLMFFLASLELGILSSNFLEGFFVGVRLGSKTIFVTRMQSRDDTNLQE